MTFTKGQSGNPSGRPKGTSQAGKLRKAIEGDLPDIIAALVSAAKTGDTSASKLLLDRVMPSLKPMQQAVSVDVRGSLSDQGASIVAAMGAGTIAPEHAQSMLAGIASLSKIIEIDDFDRRITELEKHSAED